MISIYSLLEKGFLKYLHKKNGTKLTKENLSFSFFDLAGNGYYKFPKELALPMVRLGKLHEYTKWLSAGVTGSELDDMLDKADKALTDGIKTGKNAAKIGFVISELRDRKKMVVHDELFYNIIAVQIIRHDESPTEFNNEIQLQKVAEFRKLNESNDTFFLNISEYLKALNWSNITREELLDTLNNSTMYRKETSRMMGELFGNLSESQKATLNSL
ncbi:MAG: hypothetical protein V4608_11035 [Bacteroidota bacterium]